MPRIFKFVDLSGSELYCIDDPKDILPIPACAQEISIGSSRMLVDSVAIADSSDPSTPLIQHVLVRTLPARPSARVS